MINNKTFKKSILILGFLPFSSMLWAGTAPKNASEFTQKKQKEILATLPFADQQDFENAKRGFIAKPEITTVKDSTGRIIWDLEQYKTFLSEDKPAPETVNPSLWRNAILTLEHGLFKVTDHIYQIRGFDISNITFIQGKKGWIVLDPLVSTEMAKLALDFINEKLGKRPVVAVIYSHSHVDHYGGAKGLFTEAELANEKIKIIAPSGFAEHAISENVIAGNAMTRRAVYMFGVGLPISPQGSMGSGLGIATSTGTISLLLPNTIINKTGETLEIDGVKMVFHMTPGTEAPSEMNTWFPQYKAMWMAENTLNTMHNILTLRGAQVRDPLKWAYYIDEAIDLFGDQIQVKFQSHHWPVWGNTQSIEYLKKQRDAYKFVHDQSVRLMNQGLIGSEIAEALHLPEELEKYWPVRGYYGTIKHNSKAVYQRYMGWYSGNPSDLDNLPPVEVAKKYVALAGGEANLMKNAQQNFAQGEYRWVAELLKHAVFANPNNVQAKELLADAYEQLGYQAESAIWRAVYLQGAYELRNGVHKDLTQTTASKNTMMSLPAEMLFTYLAVALNPEKVAGKKFSLNIEFSDLKENYYVSLENSVLNHKKLVINPATAKNTTGLKKPADLNLTLTHLSFLKLLIEMMKIEDLAEQKDAKVSGNSAIFKDFVQAFEPFDPYFNIVTP